MTLSPLIRKILSVPSSPASDLAFMDRALALAGRGRFGTTPNPMVGAVIVSEGEIIGEGYHRRAGSPHAEMEALGKAGTRAVGATLYCTLEPCCHHGRTPPCVEALIEAGLKRCVIAMEDPNPQVNGKSVELLRRSG